MGRMTPAPSPVLAAHSLSVNRRADAGLLCVLDGIDLAVEGGTLVDVVGPSGAGKTTLLLALARLLPGVGGTLALDGDPAESIDPRVWRARAAYLPQRSALLPGTVQQNLVLPWKLKIRAGSAAPADDELRASLDRVRLADVALDRDVERLSEGQAARIALLRTVLTAPRVLLLDEPDAALDAESAGEVGRLTREFADAGGAVVRVRHHVADGLADRRLKLAAGHLQEVGA
jgi:putative ABC transport system ATP-binding protein